MIRSATAVLAAIAIVHAGRASAVSRAIATPSRDTASASALLDAFDSLAGWTTAPSAGVSLLLAQDSGLHGKAMRLDFDFHGHGGYAVVHKEFNVALPANYEFSFAIRGDAPVNTLEFKLIDPTWVNVWWSNQRDFVFPHEWQTVTLKRSQIPFAWGPGGEREITRVAAIEFSVTAGSGGKGRVWIDDFKFTPLPPEVADTFVPNLPATPRTHGPTATRTVEWNWVLAELIVLMVAALFWTLLSRDPAEELQGMVTAVAGYGSLLLVLARVLGAIWPPLVTISFALGGASLLLVSRQGEGRGLLLKLGGLTMLVVVGRLLFIDLSTVATIWRVLLFLACGLVFLYTSYRLQPAKGA